MSRLKAHVVVGAVLRRAQAAGVFATVLHRGDPDGGVIFAVLRDAEGERLYAYEHESGWALRTAEALTGAQMSDRIAKERDFDRDLWVVELDGRGAASILSD